MRPIPQDTEEDSDSIVGWNSPFNNIITPIDVTIKSPYGQLCDDFRDVLEDHDASKQTKRKALAKMIAEVGVDD